jgi:hypothetical protein
MLDTNAAHADEEARQHTFAEKAKLENVKTMRAPNA